MKETSLEKTTNPQKELEGWQYAGWNGPAKFRVERARKLPLLQRLQEMQSLIDLGAKFQEVRRARISSSQPDPQKNEG